MFGIRILEEQHQVGITLVGEEVPTGIRKGRIAFLIGSPINLQETGILVIKVEVDGIWEETELETIAPRWTMWILLGQKTKVNKINTVEKHINGNGRGIVL